MPGLQTVNQITQILAQAAEAGRSAKVKDGEVKVAGFFNRRPSDHHAIVRSIVRAAQIEGLSAETVKKFRFAVDHGKSANVLFFDDITEASDSLASLQRMKAYTPSERQPDVSEHGKQAAPTYSIPSFEPGRAVREYADGHKEWDTVGYVEKTGTAIN